LPSQGLCHSKDKKIIVGIVHQNVDELRTGPCWFMKYAIPQHSDMENAGLEGCLKWLIGQKRLNVWPDRGGSCSSRGWNVSEKSKDNSFTDIHPTFRKFPDDMGNYRPIKPILPGEELIVAFFELVKMLIKNLPQRGLSRFSLSNRPEQCHSNTLQFLCFLTKVAM